jgi:hypothetical protein
MVRLVEVEPNRWRVDKRGTAPAVSSLGRPYVISDDMEPTEQVDGKFYTSKAAFRAVGRAHGLTEVGNEKAKPKKRASATREEKTRRRQALKRALEKYKAGYRAKRVT